MVSSLFEYPLSAANTAGIRQLLQRYLVDVLSALGVTTAAHFATHLLGVVGRSEDLREAEERCKAYLGLGARSHIPRHLAVARADLYVEQIGPWVRDCDILDLGCGNGLIGNGLQQRYGCNVTFADTVEYIDAEGQFVTITGNSLPFNDCSFDDVVIVTALHHMRNPIDELRDAVRVSRKRLVVKESVCGVSPYCMPRKDMNEMTRHFVSLGYEDQFLYTCFVDWFYNRVLETGIDVPFGFRSTAEWVDLLGRFGTIKAVVDLGIDDFLGALYHTLIVVDVQK